MGSTLMGLILLVPIVGALATLFVQPYRVRVFASVTAGVTTLIAIGLTALQWGTAPIQVAWPWMQGLGIEFGFHLDGLATISMVVIGFLTTAACVFLPHEFRGKELENSSFYAWMLGFLAAMIGVVMASNAIQFYLFWEAMLIPSAAMLAFWGDLKNKGQIALKYFIYTHIGAVLILIAILWIFTTQGVTDIHSYRDAFAGMDVSTLQILLALFVLGFGFKLAMFPFHSWLPDAYEAAPLPAVIAMAGGMMGAGIYGIIRFVYTPFPIEVISSLSVPIMVLALITLYYGGVLAFAQRNLRRFLAYSSMSQMGYILFGIASFHGLGVGGATFHILNHGVAKVLLFMIIGVLIYSTGKNRLDEMGGLCSRMPVTAFCAAVAAISLSGVPPWAGFHSEWMIFSGVYSTGYLGFAILATLGAVVTTLYAFSFVRFAFFGPAMQGAENVNEVPIKFLAPMLVLALAAIIVGIYPAPFFEWATSALGPMQLGI